MKAVVFYIKENCTEKAQVVCFTVGKGSILGRPLIRLKFTETHIQVQPSVKSFPTILLRTTTTYSNCCTRGNVQSAHLQSMSINSGGVSWKRRNEAPVRRRLAGIEDNDDKRTDLVCVAEWK